MKDILFRTENAVFSYRVAGICIQKGCVLLQKPSDDTGYAFPGGHAAFGETSAQTLVREFREELGADIGVDALQWVGEIFFPWGNKPCHQICLYYLVHLTEPAQLPEKGRFPGRETQKSGDKMGFYWAPLDEVEALELYPVHAKAFLREPDDRVRHFVYREE